MDSTFIFVTALLGGGVALLIAVVLLCIFMKRLKKQVENLPTPVYTEAFHELKKKPKKRKKNVYHVGGISPKPRRQQSTLYRNDSDESITFVPSGNEKKNQRPVVESFVQLPWQRPSAVESNELKTFAAIHNPGLADEQSNVGKTNEAFVSERGGFTKKEQRLPDTIPMQNVKKSQLVSSCQKDTQERRESTTNVTAWKRRSRGESAGHSSSSDVQAVSRRSQSSKQIVDLSKPNINMSSKPEDTTHAQFTKHPERRGLSVMDNRRQTSSVEPCTQAIDGEEQLYSNQETDTMAEFDRVIQTYNDPATIQNAGIETLEPVYMNVGALALVNNPEVHLVTGQNMPGELQNQLASQGADCFQKSNENQDYVTAQNSDYYGQTDYQDYSGQNQCEDYNGQSGYQGYEYNDQNGYQDYSGQNEYQGYDGQSGYQEYNGQAGYQDYSGQNEYQDYNGQNLCQDYNGLNEYQDYNGQNELVGNCGENAEESGYHGNLQNADKNGLHPVEGENDFQNKHQSLHRLAGEYCNQGFEEEVEIGQIYDNTIEGEEDNFYVNPNC